MAPCKKWQEALQPESAGSLISLEEDSASCCEACHAVYALTEGEQGRDKLCVDLNLNPRYVEVFPLDLSGQAVWRYRILAQDGKPCPWGIFPSASSESILEPKGPALQHIISMLTSCSCPDCNRPELPQLKPQVIERIIHMVGSCASQHSCIKPEAPRLPTRVIQVGRRSSDLRLVESQGAKGKYVCLSHCWGGCLPLRTTKGTYNQMLQSIPWSEVPRSYRGLIELCRLFGVEYVWIDSLCIIQDDAEDWTREAHNMCDVYENSWLTIAATSIPNCSHDLWAFSDRADQVRSTKVTTGLQALIAVPVPTWHPTSSDLVHHQRKFWPLLDRAWVFQEIMLSPRVLHFSMWELLWECKAATTCDCGRLEPRNKDARFEAVFETGSDADVEAMWREMVQGFSNLSLTMSMDKYVSLSGLAQKFARKRPADTYLAGAWRRSLSRDLLWLNICAIPIFTRNADHSVPTTLDRAPSWSWMKTNNRVAFADSPSRFPSYLKDTRTFFDRVYFDVEDAGCELGSAYAMGPVKSGFVRLRCHVFDGILKRGFLKEGTRSVFGKRMDTNPTIALGLRIGNVTIGFVSENIGMQTLLYLDSPSSPLGERGEVRESHEVKCVPMARARRTWMFRNEECWEVDEWVMVLLATENVDEYVRVGMAVMRGKYENEAQALEALESPPWASFSKGESVITIV
ncbi:heterokaryon incompatibility protein-domain-containing protein [Xylaria nigripes]|nr:heterokaryon incompatibility protein-domain-containing protein [Xylaria nigripes]